MTFEKISVLVPTRHRVKRLQTLLESFERTQFGRKAELVFRVDEDDKATQDYLFHYGGLRVVIGPRHQGYRSMPIFFNEMFACATGDVLMCGNDDMVFKTPGWCGMILSAANKYSDGLFDIGVKTHNETHYPFSVVSRRVAEHLGFLWDPTIFWGDIFLRDTMAAFGRAVMLPSVEIEHDWAGHHPDKVFLEGDQNDIIRRDPTYWSGTHAKAVAAAIDKLAPLQCLTGAHA